MNVGTMLLMLFLSAPILAADGFPTGTGVVKGTTEPAAWQSNPTNTFPQSDAPRDSTGSSYERVTRTAEPAKPYDKPKSKDSVYLQCDSSVEIHTTGGSKRKKADCARSKSTFSSSRSSSKQKSGESVVRQPR